MKIRGTAMHVAEKYQQLARDAQASGDRVMSENYNQHAEHYLRIVAAAQPQQQPQQTQQLARNEAEDSSDNTPANGASQPNGSERPNQDRAAPEAGVVDADSPQPFIEDMPVIDQEGQVNGTGQKAEAEDGEAEEKPRRRTRTPRTRTPRRAAPDASPEGAESAEGENAEAAAGASEEDQPKPRRRTTRTRRPKAADDTSAEPATAGE